MKDDVLAKLDDDTTTANSPIVLAEGRKAFVELDKDHPGFRDEAYRARRNAIAQIAVDHTPGTPVPDAPYVAEEHGVWKTIRQHLDPVHEAHACGPYREAAGGLGLPEDEIPQLEVVSQRTEALSGFRLEPVGGLVHPKVFLSAMSDNVFLCTQYIRHHSSPAYTPEPDVVHELIGHAVQLASPRFATLSRAFGNRAKRTTSGAELVRISRVYWYTLEFGVVYEGAALKAYGSGLLSSYGELQAMKDAEIRPLDFDAMETLEYDPTGFQPVLFAATSFESLEQQLVSYLG